MANSVVTPVVVALLLLAAGYVFDRRLNELRRASDRHTEQLAALAAQVAVMSQVISQWTGRFERLDSEIVNVRHALGQEIGSVRTEIGSVRSEVAGVRTDLTQIALAVGARVRPETA